MIFCRSFQNITRFEINICIRKIIILKDRTLKEKLAILKKIFTLFDTCLEELDSVCTEGCATCCTRNVTLTGLEAKHILDSLNSDEKNSVLTRIANEHHKNRLVPKTTINEFAQLCMEGEEPPEEAGDPEWGNCPLLADKRCMIYELRPFACRSMTSRKRCGVTGFAEMDDYTITLLNVFMQYIEHIDTGGYFGNLSDILLLESGAKNASEILDSNNILVNKPIQMLMVPPEHRKRIAKIINAIQKI